MNPSLVRIHGWFGLAVTLLGCSPARISAKELHGAWSSLFPYQYEEQRSAGTGRITGYDIEVLRSVARRTGYYPRFEELSWGDTLEAIRNGKIDFTMGATPEKSRQDWAWFTAPYRKEVIALIVRNDATPWYDTKTRWRSLQHLLEEGGTLAVTRSFYYGSEAMRWIAEADRLGRLLKTSGDEESLAKLLSGEADGFLADRLCAASVAARANALANIQPVPGTIYETGVSLMLSKKTVPVTEFRRIDEALAKLRKSGELDRLGRLYLIPHLMLITKQAAWFQIFDVIGTVAFAISGVLIARRERYDILGACVLAALPAVGGGVIRDLMTSRSPIAILESPQMILLVLGTVLVGWLFYVFHDWRTPSSKTPRTVNEIADNFRWTSSRGALEIFDALGLASFTVSGVMVALTQHCEPLWLWGPILAVLTAAGGGILRDVLRSTSDIPTLKGSVYPEVAFVWGLVYSLVILLQGMDLKIDTTFTLTLAVMVAAFITRILVIHFSIPSIFLGQRPRLGK
jgi:polar amino acid transport system substrate-binding protein